MIGNQIERLRNERGLTVRGLAKRAHISPPHLSRIENGHRECSVDIAAALDQALSTGRYLTQLAELPVHNPYHALQIGLHDVNRRGFLTTAVYTAATIPSSQIQVVEQIVPESGKKVSAVHVQTVRAWIDMVQRSDEAVGGGIGRQAVGAFLSTEVEELCRGVFDTPIVRSEMFSAAAELAYLAGWKAHDVGQEGIAERYWNAAVTLAVQAESPGQVAFTRRILALQGADIGQPEATVAHAEAAVEAAKGLGGHLEALMHVAAARVHAEAGNGRQARAALKKAEPHLHEQPDPDTPRYARSWCPHKANLLNQTGHALTALGALEDAVDYHTAARDLWSYETHPRVWGLDCYLVGLAHWNTGDHGQAETQWRRAIDVLDGLESQRATDRINSIAGYMPNLVPR